MTILYNCKHDGDQYRITKFDDDHNPISSYLTTATECDCPAGQRPMCRHREMLPYFIARDAVGTGWWYDFDRGGWVDMRQDDEMPPLPNGVQMLSLDEPAILYNAIAEAIGEPEVTIPQHSSVAEQSAHNGSVDGSIPSAATKPYRKPNDGRRA